MKLTNTSGQTVEVYLKSSTSDSVTVTLVKNRKVHTLPLANLSKKSQELVAKWKKAGGGLSTDFEIDFDSGRSTKSIGYDDKQQVIRPTVTVLNDDLKLSSRKLKVTNILLGRAAIDSSLIYVFSKTTKDLPSIEASEEFEYKLAPLQTVYDRDGYKHGARYVGYAVVIHDSKNKVYASKVQPANFEDEIVERFSKIQAKKYYDKYFQKMSITSTSGY